jgi:hypothetical protein
MASFEELCCYCCVCGCVTLLLVLLMSFSSLEFNEYGLDYSSISKSADPTPYSGGIHFLGVGHHFILFPKTVQTLEFSDEKLANGPPITSRTFDGLEVTLEISFQYKLIYEHLFDLYMTYGEDYQRFYTNIAVDILTDAATNYTAYDFFMDRSKIGGSMQNALNEQFKSICFATIDFFQLRSVDLPDKFEDAIQLSEVKKQDIQKAYAEMNKTVVELETVKMTANLQMNVTINIAIGEASAILAQNNASVNSFKAVQSAQSASYLALKKSLNLTNDQLLEFMKAKVVRDHVDDNLVVSLNSFEQNQDL